MMNSSSKFVRTGTPPEPTPQPNFLNQLWDARTARIIFTALIIAIVLMFLRAARETLTLFLFSILFAYFLAPLVGRLQGPLRGRGKAILVVYLVLVGLLIGLGFVVGPRLADESKSLAQTLPSLLNKLGSGQVVVDFGQAHHWAPARIAQVQSFVVSHRGDLSKYGAAAASKIASPIQHIWWLILIPILTLFFLNDGETIASETVTFGRSTGERNIIRGLLYDVNIMLGSYIRSQIILAALTTAAYCLVLTLLHVPYALILGPIAGFLEFVPVVGPAVAAVSVLVISVLAGYPHVLWLVLFLGVWRLLQDYVNAPRIMGKSLEINPLTQIFAVLAGGEIAGVVGALISVPVVAILRILWRRMHNQDGSQTVAPSPEQLEGERHASV